MIHLRPTLSPLIPAPCCPLGPLAPGSPRSPCGTKIRWSLSVTSQPLTPGSQPNLHCSRWREDEGRACWLLLATCDWYKMILRARNGTVFSSQLHNPLNFSTTSELWRLEAGWSFFFFLQELNRGLKSIRARKSGTSQTDVLLLEESSNVHLPRACFNKYKYTRIYFPYNHIKVLLPL